LCGPRKHFYLRKHINNANPNFSYFEFIESIGSTYHLLYPYNAGLISSNKIYQSGCYNPWSIGLACKSNLLSQQYQSCTYLAFSLSFPNSCVYYSFSIGFPANSKINHFSAFPNPTNNKVALNFYLENSEIITINVIDVLGRVFLTNKNVSFKEGENTFELNTTDLESGVYSIIIENPKFKISHPIIIQN
jgi:hypothetical protein